MQSAYLNHFYIFLSICSVYSDYSSPNPESSPVRWMTSHRPDFAHLFTVGYRITSKDSSGSTSSIVATHRDNYVARIFGDFFQLLSDGSNPEWASAACCFNLQQKARGLWRLDYFWCTEWNKLDSTNAYSIPQLRLAWQLDASKPDCLGTKLDFVH